MNFSNIISNTFHKSVRIPNMKNDWIEVLCNICRHIRFQVIKPEKEISPDHLYFTCTTCLHRKNMRSRPVVNVTHIKGKKLYEDV